MFIYPDEVLCGGKPCNVKQDVTFGAVLEPVYVLEGRRRRRQRKKRGREFGQWGRKGSEVRRRNQFIGIPGEREFEVFLKLQVMLSLRVGASGDGRVCVSE